MILLAGFLPRNRQNRFDLDNRTFLTQVRPAALRPTGRIVSGVPPPAHPRPVNPPVAARHGDCLAGSSRRSAASRADAEVAAGAQRNRCQGVQRHGARAPSGPVHGLCPRDRTDPAADGGRVGNRGGSAIHPGGGKDRPATAEDVCRAFDFPVRALTRGPCSMAADAFPPGLPAITPTVPTRSPRPAHHPRRVAQPTKGSHRPRILAAPSFLLRPENRS